MIVRFGLSWSSLVVLAACSNAPAQDRDEEAVGVAQSKSQCGCSWDAQDVELYDGSNGVSTTFVVLQERAVGYYPGPGCSGTLISRDLYLSAGHCYYVQGDYVGFGYQRSGSDPTLVRPIEYYQISEIVEQEYYSPFDYSIVRLSDNPGDVWGWASVSARDPDPGELLTIIGHPLGMPKVVAMGPLVDYASPIGSNWFRHAVDTMGGSSGSGVIDPSGFLVGIHTNAGCQTSDPVQGNSAVRMSQLVAHSATLQALTHPIHSYPSGWNFGNPSVYTNIAADFNGDGLGDYARLGATTAYVFMGQGNGTFTAVTQSYPSGWNFGSPSTYATITGDFDYNGWVDHARLGASAAYVFLSNGNGTFASTVQDYPSGLDFGTNSAWPPVSGDFDGDGRADYARLGATSAHIFLSNGDATFSHSTQAYPNTWDFGNPSSYQIVTGDFNADGKADYARLGATSGYFFTSNGDGTFSSSVQPYANGFDYGSGSAWESISGDFDNDMGTDFARLGATSAHFFMSNGNGSFSASVQNYPSGWDFGNPSPWRTITGDFNGDGWIDYARLDATGARLFTNNGDGTFAHPVQSYPSGWDFSPNSSWPPITADFDGDYRTDYARLGDTQAYLFIGK